MTGRPMRTSWPVPTSLLPPPQRGVTYAPEMPPSTRKVEAVMKLDSSEARKSTALAISSGSPKRPIGTWTRRRAARSSSLAKSSWSSGVLTGPGHRALTRTPSRANCTPSSRGIEVGVEDGVVLGRADAGVVEGDVDRAVRLLGRAEEGVHVLLADNVDAHE